MSDLIDFDSPNGPSLASPLIPLPATSKNSPNEAGPRRSMENNPFDMVMKKVCDYERNKEDPFERVIEKAMGRVSIESKDDFIIPKRRRYSDILKINKSLDETHEMSIITDLNDTNLIGDNFDAKQIIESWKTIPEVNVSPTADQSFLNDSAMNDSLLDTEAIARPRSMSQGNFLMPKSVSPKNRRSMSVTDTVKNNMFGQDNSVQSSVFDDPLNNAFRQFSLRSNSNLSNQFDLSISRLRIERLNSDSSVFSGLSNISGIPTESSARVRNERFCSESSIYSGISNLSVIPPNNSSSSCDSSVFSNDTINKGFVASRSQLSSTGSAKNDNADLIKKFFEIKTRLSTSHMKLEDEKSNSDEKLIDVGTTESFLNNKSGVDDIIVHEAEILAKTFEMMATSKTSNSAASDDNLLFSKTQLNFDDLPLSDDETVDNLIELPNSPVKNTAAQQNSNIIEQEQTNSVKTSSPKDDIKALESEFVENHNPDKKAMAATLLLDFEKLIKQDDNPDAQKVLKDLQRLLGVHCDNNTEILQVCLEGSPPSEKKSESKDENNISDDQCSDNVNKLSNSKEVTDNKQIEVVQTNEKEDESSESKEEQNLAINLLRSLSTIVTKDTGGSAIDVLKSLGTLLNMATELKTKKDDKLNVTPKPTTRLQNRSINSFKKSPSPNNLDIKPQNKSFDGAQSRRNVSINTSNSTNNILDSSFAKDKRKSHLISLKKRFPSDPGFVESALNKIKAEPSNTITRQSSLTSSKSTIEPMKTKFKKKSSTEVVTKKGPLKAVIPLGRMQKQDTVRLPEHNGAVTPPKVPSINITSSTPNSNDRDKNSKSKPTASSTPNVGLKTNRTKYNMSPLSLNSSMKVNVSGSKISSRRSERPLSPQKRPLTPRKSTDNVENSRLPRFSPGRVRNYSFNDLKTAKSPQSTIGINKISSEKKIQRHSVSSPLKNSNKLTYKTKPLSLTSRLSKSGTVQTGPEKENYA